MAAARCTSRSAGPLRITSKQLGQTWPVLDRLVQQLSEPVPLLVIEREDTTVSKDITGTLRKRGDRELGDSASLSRGSLVNSRPLLARQPHSKAALLGLCSGHNLVYA